MKILHALPATLLSLMLAGGAQAQDETGLPGDHFSLEGALEMFKKAENPEQFEKLLNTEKNGVNNLDLNDDGKIDYIRVVNKKDGNVQLFVLQALVSASESQDVAVIQLEKTGDNEAVIQIEGDEDIYGEPKIVEPTEDEEETAYNNAALMERPHGPNAAFAPAGLVVNVWFWPSVRFVFAPYYTVWVSPWRWYRYPAWWRPWRPMAWHVYQPYAYRYRPRYVVAHTHRIVRAPYIYRPMRVTSVSVYNRHREVVNNYRTYHRSAPPRQFDRSRDRNIPSRRYDRSAEVNRNMPSRRYDRNDEINRNMPSRRYDRNDEINRNMPSRRYDRNDEINRNMPSRRYDRNEDINRNIPQPDRSPRTVPRSPREYDRSPSPREINRGQGTVDRPQRQFTPRGGPVVRPQERQMHRGPRPAHVPQRGPQSSRTPRERS